MGIRYMVTTAPQRMELREAPAPLPGDRQALVRIEAVSLCGSDFHLYDGSRPIQPPPAGERISSLSG